MPKTRFVPKIVWAMVLTCIIALFFTLGIFAAWASVVSIPSITNFENRKVSESTKIYDRTGNIVLYDVHGAVRRTTVPLSEISPSIQHATISIEDAEFYRHNGFRPFAFARAALANILSHSYKEGGSTITQQVVKNALLTQNKTIFRKVEEIILSIRLEQQYSKDQILETYLNEIGYGGTIYGVQEASQYLFGVDAKDVDLAQAAYLAAIPQAPTHLSPYGTHKDELDSRKNLALQRMLDNGYITKDQYMQAKDEKVQFKDEATAGIKAPHFVFFVRDYLEQKYGPDTVENGGLKVITTLDYDLQQKAEDIIHRHALSNAKNFNASNAGLVAIDPKTGQILTMVGSRDYFDPAIDGKVNIALAKRQPGSAFKPFVYAAAFQKGYTPDTVVFDLQTQFSTSCDAQDVASDTPPCYSPQNYDGTFKGPMTFRNALAQSENVPAVKVLYLVGVADAITLAEKMGITSLLKAAHYGLTLVLGGGEVSLLDMTSAYSVFANDGVRNPATGVLRVEDKSNAVLESFTPQSSQVLDPQIARQMNDVLSDNEARTPEFGADSPLNFQGYDVADKTGTTNDFKDTWIIGYTPSLAAGAWAGNNDNKPMVKKIAAFIVAPMWHEFMAYALNKYSSASDAFVPPSPEPNFDSLPPVLRGEWNGDPSLGTHDILYWVDKSNPRSGAAGSQNDSQFARWEYPVQIWAQSGGVIVSGNPAIPYGVTPQPIASGFTITSPLNGTYVPWGVAINGSVSYPNDLQVTQVSYYYNGGLAGVSTQPPFAIQFRPDMHGVGNIRAVGLLSNGSTVEANSTVSVQ